MSLLKIVSVVIATVLGGVGAGLAAHALIRGQNARLAPEPIPVTFAGLRLVVPSDYVRGGAESGNRLNVVMRHPDMGPAADVRSHGDPASLVFLAIMPSDGEMDPGQRVQDLYGRFFEPDAWRNPGGLLMRRFQAGSPYEDEELYLAPPDGREFAARCRKAGRTGERQTDLVGESCLWRFRREGADIQVRFSPERLPQWEALAAGVRARIDGWSGKTAAN